MPENREIDPRTIVDAYLHLVMGELHQATKEMREAAKEMHNAAAKLREREMMLASSLDGTAERLLLDIKRRAGMIAEEELKRFRQSCQQQNNLSDTKQLNDAQKPNTGTSDTGRRKKSLYRRIMDWLLEE